MATFSYSGFGIRNSGFGIWLFRPLRLELLRLEPRHFYSRTYRTNETNFGSSKHYMIQDERSGGIHQGSLLWTLSKKACIRSARI